MSFNRLLPLLLAFIPALTPTLALPFTSTPSIDFCGLTGPAPFNGNNCWWGLGDNSAISCTCNRQPPNESDLCHFYTEPNYAGMEFNGYGTPGTCYDLESSYWNKVAASMTLGKDVKSCLVYMEPGCAGPSAEIDSNMAKCPWPSGSGIASYKCPPEAPRLPPQSSSQYPPTLTPTPIPTPIPSYGQSSTGTQGGGLASLPPVLTTLPIVPPPQNPTTSLLPAPIVPTTGPVGLPPNNPTTYPSYGQPPLPSSAGTQGGGLTSLTPVPTTLPVLPPPQNPTTYPSNGQPPLPSSAGTQGGGLTSLTPVPTTLPIVPPPQNPNTYPLPVPPVSTVPALTPVSTNVPLPIPPLASSTSGGVVVTVIPNPGPTYGSGNSSPQAKSSSTKGGVIATSTPNPGPSYGGAGGGSGGGGGGYSPPPYNPNYYG